ncbi:MAG TPA: hypothetical protein VGF94_09755 [Kofleriaceae bacterium]|jgi:outer membrane receptor protein involved in Fe transport
MPTKTKKLTSSGRAQRLRARCVASFARALDRAALSLQNDDGSASFPGAPRTLVQHTASILIYGGGDCTEFDAWSAESARAVAMAYALHAPADWLRSLAADADKQYAWLEWWDAPGGGRYQGERTDDEIDKALVTSADKLLDMRPAPTGLAVAS